MLAVLHMPPTAAALCIPPVYRAPRPPRRIRIEPAPTSYTSILLHLLLRLGHVLESRFPPHGKPIMRRPSIVAFSEL